MAQLFARTATGNTSPLSIASFRVTLHFQLAAQLHCGTMSAAQFNLCRVEADAKNIQR
jgi:hypothetical protein